MTQQRATLIAASIAMALSIIPMFLGTFPVFLSALFGPAFKGLP